MVVAGSKCKDEIKSQCCHVCLIKIYCRRVSFVRPSFQRNLQTDLSIEQQKELLVMQFKQEHLLLGKKKEMEDEEREAT